MVYTKLLVSFERIIHGFKKNTLKGKLIYFGDPMCSWCYGFVPHISKIKAHYNDVLNFQLVMGGLRPGGTETNADIADFLRHHWEQVQERSGQPFNYGILEDKDFVYDTEPPSRAVLAMRFMKPEAEFDFYKEVQAAFYVDNSNTNDPEVYGLLAEKHGVDKDEFNERFASEELKAQTGADFKFSQKLGIRGFPTTVLQIGERMHLLARGYTEADGIIEQIDELLEEATSK